MKSSVLIRDIIDSFPGDFPVRDIRVCCHWTAVSSRWCGLASTFMVSCPGGERSAAGSVGALMDKSAGRIAELSLSENLIEATIGMASLNSMIEIDESRCSVENAYDIMAPCSEGKNVVMVGHFPFAEKLASIAGNLVIVQRPKGESPALDEKEMKALEEADVAIITGTSLINHSLDGILEHTGSKAVKIMAGPTTPLSPILFDYGFSYLCGVKVVDEVSLMRTISEGATFRETKGVKMLTMHKERRTVK
jgi:uncharacterized protein (DUF4213/DUF364 family)